MFDYTQAAFSKILKDFKRIRNVITVFVHLFSIAYLIYALATKTGFLIANIALLALTASYFAFFIVMETKKNKTRMRKRIKAVYGWCKRLIKLPLLVLAVYSLALSKTEFDPISFMMTLLMIICWVLEILFYCIIRLLEIEKNFLLDSLHKDVHQDLQWAGKIPFIGDRISNAFDAIPLSDHSEAHYQKLQPIVEQRAKEREEKKQAAQLQKIQIKLNAKQAKIEIKFAKKQAKKDEKEQKRAVKLLKKQKFSQEIDDEIATTK